MNDVERDALLGALAQAVRQLQHSHDKMADVIHNLSQRMSLQEATKTICEMVDGEIPERKH